MKRWLKITLICLAAVLVVGIAGFALYTADYYRADLAGEAVAPVTLQNNLTILRPDTPNGTGLIFYPGAKVEANAYLPLLELLRQQGVTCVLIEMPFHLAILDQNAADQVFPRLPEITQWYMGGHSLGGAMASSYTAAHPNEIAGVILLGAYIYGDVPVEKALTIYGTEDTVMDLSKVDYTENVVVLAGGNHAGFGNYGPQQGDGQALLTKSEQQAQTARAILAFMENETVQEEPDN